MDAQDRKAIDDLFAKLGQVERSAGARDAEAEQFIRQRVDAQPGSPYYMAQTIVIQEHALNAAQARIQELEQQLASRPASGGGFLSGLFGGGSRQTRSRSPGRHMLSRAMASSSRDTVSSRAGPPGGRSLSVPAAGSWRVPPRPPWVSRAAWCSAT